MATTPRPRPAFSLQAFPFGGLVGAALLAIAGGTVVASHLAASPVGHSAVEKLPVVTDAP
jgi:hypothetical protein